MSKRKKSKAVPVVLVITILVAALAAGCFLVKPLLTDPLRTASEKDLARRQAETEQKNLQIQAEYNAAILDLQNQASQPSNPSWPAHKSEGWDILDLSNYPLENPTAESKTRADLMTGGMLLVNEWHSRPDDFDESKIVSIGKYLGGNEKVQVKDYNVRLFPVAADALLEAVNAAKAEGMQHYIVEEAYRTWEEQNAVFQKKMDKLSSRYSGDALITAAKKEVNYPGTSEYNSGLSFTLRLYSKDDPEVSAPKYSTTPQGIWMNENCWKYGLVIRFPQAGWPLETTQDKSFKTGVSLKMNLYRYVGKGNAAVMHYLDLCLEEYIEYLQEHPHIALFEDGVLKYEIYRQYVGEAQSFDVQLTRNARSYSSSMDNMGAIITVFEH
ncbi:MAG: D-alanyl-D-alanine carboxypeptidase family protein [Clostridia bacterium]|nr:D-alanyl-D-alanine carboxypeptidase family protein [Clostridia bacterium]